MEISSRDWRSNVWNNAGYLVFWGVDDSCWTDDSISPQSNEAIWQEHFWNGNKFGKHNINKKVQGIFNLCFKDDEDEEEEQSGNTFSDVAALQQKALLMQVFIQCY